MPGTIRVSVLEAVDVPEIFSDGTSSKDLTAKVTLGTRQFKTKSRAAEEGRIDFWKSNFVFLVTNLRDKLVVVICDNEDRCLTQTTIEVSSIIEKGSRDEFVELKGGGRIHLSISFSLSDEERKKIEAMRVAVLKRREEELVRKTIVFRKVQPDIANDLRAASPSAVVITEADDSFAIENKDPQDTSTGPLGFGSTTKPLPPVLAFDYAKAVGVQSGRGRKWMAEDKTFRAADNGQDECLGPANVLERDNGNIAGAKVSHVLDSEPVVTSSSSEQSILYGNIRKVDFKGGTNFNSRNSTQRWDEQQGVHNLTENPKLEPSSGLGLRPEARLGPGARWAQKNGLDSRWTSPEKARRFIRVECNSQVSAPFKARTNILKLIKAAAGSLEGYGDDQSLQERHNLSNSIEAALNKVVGGAAMLLAALFMLWPLSDSSKFRNDGLSGEDS